MPCLTYDPPDNTPSPVPDLKRQIADLEAALCAALTVLDNESENGEDGIGMLNLKEAGVNEKKLRKWWASHKKRDADRRRAEYEKQRKEQLRASALSKLSDEERQALGIK